jgi:hypothetical protein
MGYPIRAGRHYTQVRYRRPTDRLRPRRHGLRIVRCGSGGDPARLRLQHCRLGNHRWGSRRGTACLARHHPQLEADELHHWGDNDGCMQPVLPRWQFVAIEELEASAGCLKGSAPRSGYWWPGRYSTPASQPGAYVSSGGRVFPTRRNSGLSGDALRAEQEAFAARAAQNGKLIGQVRGQSQESGLTRLSKPDRLADPGAEKAIQRGYGVSQ